MRPDVVIKVLDSPWIKISDRKKEVPKLLSIINNRAADKSTGNEIAPMIAVTKNAQIVKGILVSDMPFVLRFKTVTI